MELIYASEKLKEQFTSLKAARKLFGGNTPLSVSLLSRINALENANTLHDIVVQPAFHFHNLINNRKGYFSIDVTSRREAYRIILQPLDENREPYDDPRIDQIAKSK